MGKFLYEKEVYAIFAHCFDDTINDIKLKDSVLVFRMNG